MNSYRMGHLTKKGGILEGQQFPVLFDTEAEYGEEQGTIRNLTIRYLTEQKQGKYEGKPMQRWKLSGLEGFEKEREIVKELINSGKMDVPASADGRYTNIESINVQDLILKNSEAKNAAITQRLSRLESAPENEKPR